jgi:MerR family copper efflux transcriptional regulator
MKSTAADATPWSIGDVAQRFDLATHVLRHWEDVGLLRPSRDSAGRRRYGRNEAVRIAVILRSKAAGMSLDQVLVLLDADANDRREVLGQHVADLDRRMAEMARSREMTLHALDCRAHDVATCAHFRACVDDILEGTREGFPAFRLTHAAPHP